MSSTGYRWTEEQKAKVRKAKKHGHAFAERPSPTYVSWANMIARCRRHPTYLKYGITVCDRWKSFKNFLEDMGERPEGPKGWWSIERIDNDKNYEPSNCRWATFKEQMANLRSRKGISKPRKLRI